MKKHVMIAFFYAITTVVWVAALIASDRPIFEGILIVTSQLILIAFVLFLLVKTAPKYMTVSGPSFEFVITLHVATFYSITNLIPALLPFLRPSDFPSRIPIATGFYYFEATIAAVIMLAGFLLGSKLSAAIINKHTDSINRPYSWLPSYKFAIYLSVLVLIYISIATLLYGVDVAAESIDEESKSSMSAFEQLFFYGIFKILPLAPFLTAVAYIKATNKKQLNLCFWGVLISCFVTVFLLLIWGQRSTALISLILPFLLLVNARKINLKKNLFLFIGLLFIVYISVTFVRNSNLINVLSNNATGYQPSVTELISSIFESQEGTSVEKRGLYDMTYRAAGLEGAAAILQYQSENNHPYMFGSTSLAGFIHAMPVSLRPEAEVYERIKTAPSYFGIFDKGDWVCTIITELIFDFGPFLLFLPSVFYGFILATIDSTLLLLGQRDIFSGALILRVMFLLTVYNDGSFADWVLMFFKGTFGFSILLVVLGILLRVMQRRGRYA